MATRTLNWAGGNSHVIDLWGAAASGPPWLEHWGTSNPTVVQDRGTPTNQALTWNGESVIGLYDGTNPTYMPCWHQTANPASQTIQGTHFFLTANKQAGTAAQMLRDTGAIAIITASATRIGTVYASSAADTTYTMTNGDYFAVFFTYDANDGTKASNNTWYGKDDGTAVAKQASAWAITTSPNGRLISRYGGDGSTLFWSAYLVLVGYIDVVLTSGQMQAIVDAPYATFFGAAATLGIDDDPEWITVVQPWATDREVSRERQRQERIKRGR